MALPLFASILLGTVASKVVPQFATKKLGMDPTAAAFLGMAAGFGAGAYSSGVFNPSVASTSPVSGSLIGGLGGHRAVGAMNAAGTASSLSNAFKAPTSTYNLFDTMAAPSSYDILHDTATPYLVPDVAVGSDGFRSMYWHNPLFPKQDINLGSIGGGTPAHGNVWGGGSDIGNQTSWDKLKAYATSPDQQRYLGNAAATLIEGMMQEKPKQGFLSGGGGGGGGGMAPAYGGGGGGGQVGVTWGFGGNKGGFVPQPIT
ncbi:MAG: hypothetical protein VW907_06335 [Opitutae bacterium]|jgi:hypothetical protein